MEDKKLNRIIKIIDSASYFIIAISIIIIALTQIIKG